MSARAEALGGGGQGSASFQAGCGAGVMLSSVASLVDHRGRWYLLAETLLLLDGVGTSILTSFKAAV